MLVLPPQAALLGGSAPAAADTSKSIGMTVFQTLLQVVAFIALMLVASRRVLPWMSWQVGKTGSRELFTLAVVSVAIGTAYGVAEVSEMRTKTWTTWR